MVLAEIDEERSGNDDYSIIKKTRTDSIVLKIRGIFNGGSIVICKGKIYYGFAKRHYLTSGQPGSIQAE